MYTPVTGWLTLVVYVELCCSPHQLCIRNLTYVRTFVNCHCQNIFRTSPFIYCLLAATLGNVVVDFLAGLSLHTFTTEIVEIKDHENFEPKYLDNLMLRVVTCMLLQCTVYTGWSKKWSPSFNFAITLVDVHQFYHFFTVTRNIWCVKVKLPLPPYLYSVTTLPCKNTTLWRLMSTFGAAHF